MVRVRLGYTMAICLVLQHQVSPIFSVYFIVMSLFTYKIEAIKLVKTTTNKCENISRDEKYEKYQQCT